MRQFFDVVHQTVELPLRVDLLLPAQREAIEPLVVPQVAEHRLDGGESAAVQRTSARRIDGPPHALAGAFRAGVGLAAKEADLPRLRLLRRAQALLPQRTGQAVALGALELHGDEAVVDAVGAVLVERLAGGAEAGAGIGVVSEVRRPKVAALLRWRSLVVQRIGQRLVVALILEAFVALPHAVVGDQRRYLLRGQGLDVGGGVVAGIRRHQGLRRAQGGGGLDHRQQQFVFAAGAVGLRFDDDLMAVVDDVDVLVACHAGLRRFNPCWSLDIPFGSQQNAAMNRLFLRRRSAP